MQKKIALLMAGMALAGCTDFLAERMVAPPNGMRTQGVPATKPGGNETVLQIPVGPPGATLAAWVLEPKQETPLRGTILVLHGFLNDHSQLSAAGRALCDSGYRAVLIDLRGHGASTGNYITFGVEDAHDLSQVTTYLQDHHLCGQDVGVFGTSYGAATAILFAGGDPRVKAVVAVAPFSTLREEAPYFGKHLLPMPALFFSDADFTHVVDSMGHLASFNPDDSSPLAAIKKTTAHVRLFHGDADMIIPSHSSEELAAAAPDRTLLTILPGQGHLAVCFDLLGELHEGTRDWFDRYLAQK